MQGEMASGASHGVFPGFFQECSMLDVCVRLCARKNGIWLLTLYACLNGSFIFWMLSRADHAEDMPERLCKDKWHLAPPAVCVIECHFALAMLSRAGHAEQDWNL